MVSVLADASQTRSQIVRLAVAQGAPLVAARALRRMFANSRHVLSTFMDFYNVDHQVLKSKSQPRTGHTREQPSPEPAEKSFVQNWVSIPLVCTLRPRARPAPGDGEVRERCQPRPERDDDGPRERPDAGMPGTFFSACQRWATQQRSKYRVARLLRLSSPLLNLNLLTTDGRRIAIGPVRSPHSSRTVSRKPCCKPIRFRSYAHYTAIANTCICTVTFSFDKVKSIYRYRSRSRRHDPYGFTEQSLGHADHFET